MPTQFQGLIIKKTPFQDRALMVQLLLREGQKASVLFYGGQGGGSKKKPSQLELGTMLNVHVKPSARPKEVVVAKEWNVLWMHKKIRHQYQAFNILCFYLQVIDKMAPEVDWASLDHVSGHDQAIGPFRVLSNALFYLEDSLEKEKFSPHQHVMVFTAKLMAEMGVFPQTDACAVCGISLRPQKPLLLMPDRGGATCLMCAGFSHEQMNDDHLGAFLDKVWPGRYGDIIQEMAQLTEGHWRGHAQALINYLMYQFNWDLQSLGTIKLL